VKNLDGYDWAHPVVTVLIDAGLNIQSLREHPYSVDSDQITFMKKDVECYWRTPHI
jgi:hypothetical protein